MSPRQMDAESSLCELPVKSPFEQVHLARRFGASNLVGHVQVQQLIWTDSRSNCLRETIEKRRSIPPSLILPYAACNRLFSHLLTHQLSISIKRLPEKRGYRQLEPNLPITTSRAVHIKTIQRPFDVDSSRTGPRGASRRIRSSGLQGFVRHLNTN